MRMATRGLDDADRALQPESSVSPLVYEPRTQEQWKALKDPLARLGTATSVAVIWLPDNVYSRCRRVCPTTSGALRRLLRFSIKWR
jgi:hypothetical protein